MIEPNGMIFVIVFAILAVVIMVSYYLQIRKEMLIQNEKIDVLSHSGNVLAKALTKMMHDKPESGSGVVSKADLVNLRPVNRVVGDVDDEDDGDAEEDDGDGDDGDDGDDVDEDDSDSGKGRQVQVSRKHRFRSADEEEHNSLTPKFMQSILGLSGTGRILEGNESDDGDGENCEIIHTIISSGHVDGLGRGALHRGTEPDVDDNNGKIVEVGDSDDSGDESGDADAKSEDMKRPELKRSQLDEETNVVITQRAGKCTGQGKKPGSTCSKKALKGKVYCREHLDKMENARVDPNLGKNDVQLNFTDGSSASVALNGGEKTENPVISAASFNDKFEK